LQNIETAPEEEQDLGGVPLLSSDTLLSGTVGRGTCGDTR